jgi:YVTN family beta-propeller protein
MTCRLPLPSLLLLGVFISTIAPLSAAETPQLQVQQKWQLGGEGGWDYLTLDAVGHRLFVSRATRVDVVDTADGKLLGTIPDTAGVHGIALWKELNRGFTSNGRANTVTVFSLDTYKVIQQAPVTGKNPDAILFEPKGRHVFTFNGTSKDVSVLDAVTLAEVATIAVPDKPEFAVDDGQGQIFVNIESDPGQIVVIDSVTLKKKALWPLKGCNSPSGLALDGVHHRLFSVCDGKIMAVTDAQSGKSVARVPIGSGPDAAAFDAKRGMVYSSNGEGTLSVVHQDSADHYRIVQTLATQRGARTMALDEGAGRIYLATADFGPAPPATQAEPHPRPALIPNSFVILTVGAP